MTGHPPRDPARRGPLAGRNFRSYFVGKLTSGIGTGMVPVALSFAVLHRGGGAGEVGWVLGAATLPMVVFMLAGGVLADRFARRTLMLSADYTRSIVQCTLGFAIVFAHPPLVMFIALELVVGTGEALFVPSMTGLIPSLTTPENLQRANALNSIAWTTGSLVGPAIGGVLVVTVGAGWGVVADGLSYLVSAISLTALRIDHHDRVSSTSFLRDLGTGWSEFRQRTWLWSIVLQFSFFHLFVYAPFAVLGVVIARDDLGGGIAWGIILASVGAGSVAGGLTMLRLRPRFPLRTAEISVLGWACPLVALALHAPVAVIAGAGGLAGVGFGCFGPLWDSTMQREIPPELLSRVSSYDWFGSVATLPLGYIVAAPIASAIGIRTSLIGGAAVMLASVAAVLSVPSIRNLPARPGDLITSGGPNPATIGIGE